MDSRLIALFGVPERLPRMVGKEQTTDLEQRLWRLYHAIRPRWKPESTCLDAEDCCGGPQYCDAAAPHSILVGSGTIQNILEGREWNDDGKS